MFRIFIRRAVAGRLEARNPSSSGFRYVRSYSQDHRDQVPPNRSRPGQLNLGTKDSINSEGPIAASNSDTGTRTRPLPDLRQGIPLEFNAKTGRSPLGLAENPEQSSGGDSGDGGIPGGELPKSAYESSQDRWRNRVANYLYASFAVLGFGAVAYLGREWESESEKQRHADSGSGWTPISVFTRAKARLTSQIDVFTEPTFPKLLPVVEPAPPFTLVLGLEDLLIHSEWSRDHGWRMAKRPGVDYFLRYLSQYYELVIFTTLPFAAADPVIRKLDPFRIIMWPLSREATRYEKGEYIKDLSYLNRDLSKVVMIDTVPAHAKRQPENAIILKPWNGDAKDTELVALIPFLENLAAVGIDDTRKVLASFEGKDIASEFAKREANAREAFRTQLQEERAKRSKPSGIGLLARKLGIQSFSGLPPGELTPSQALEQGKTFSDQIRERGLKQYQAMEKEIQENGERWLKEMEAEEKRMQDESVKSMKSGFVGWFGTPGDGSSGK